jgi:predicted membrane protein
MNARYFFGILLILIGAAYILDSFNVFSAGFFLHLWWPVLIIALGVFLLSRARHSFLSGLFVTVVGILLLASHLDIVPNFWSLFWPLIIIILGLWLVTSKFVHRRPKATDTSDIDFVAIFSGSNERVVTDNFKGGSISTFFGGIELDLRGSGLSPEGATLDITAAFGGVEIIIPNNWKILSSGLPLLGGFANKTRQDDDISADKPVLKINYLAMFGGIEIRNNKKSEFD